jgi:hypothetical protein
MFATPDLFFGLCQGPVSLPHNDVLGWAHVLELLPNPCTASSFDIFEQEFPDKTTAASQLPQRMIY